MALITAAKILLTSFAGETKLGDLLDRFKHCFACLGGERMVVLQEYDIHQSTGIYPLGILTYHSKFYGNVSYKRGRDA